MSNRGTLLALVLFSALLHQPLLGLAEESEEDQEQPIKKVAPSPTSAPAQAARGNPQDTILPETSVSSSRIRDERINKTQSITKITSDDLEKRQVSNVFDAVRNTPGVSIDGGPRLNAMSFNIRGYTEEDVAVSVDGVLKNYEKYRSKGTYIEPDLLKTIEIRRGPQISSNTGYLGGAVITTTKDAENFLRPGQTVGGRVKFGYGNNNDEYLRSYLAYARPHERIDLLYNYTNRQSNNIIQGNGEELEFSNLSTASELYKITIYPTDALKISTSLTKLEQSPMRQRYDTTTNIDFTPPYVMRAIDEETIAQTLTYTPDSKWINIRASLGTGHTKQDETLPLGWIGNLLYTSTTLYCDGYILRRRSDNLAQSAYDSARRCRGDRLDAYNFKNTNFDLSNTATLYETSNINMTLFTGVQYFKQKRELLRSFDNPASISTSSAQEPASGVQTTSAYYIQPSLRIQRFSLTPGYRKDFVKQEAIDDTKEGLEIANQTTKIRSREEIYTLSIAFDLIPNSLTLFSNYGQGFRAIPISTAFVNNGRYVNPLVWGDLAGSVNSASLCPTDGSSCDDVFRMQRVENTEGGVSYNTPRLFGSNIQLNSKATFYHSHTSNSVLGTTTVFNPGSSRSGIAPIYGTQIRNGWEFENSLNYRNLYAQASYSRISGKIIYPQTNTSGPLYTVPGNTLNLTLGANIGKNIDINLNYRRVSEKLYLNSLAGPNAQFGTQDGYELFNAGIRWSPNQHLTFRLLGENLTNEEYYLDGGFAGDIGLPGPGRNIKFYAEFIY